MKVKKFLQIIQIIIIPIYSFQKKDTIIYQLKLIKLVKGQGSLIILSFLIFISFFRHPNLSIRFSEGAILFTLKYQLRFKNFDQNELQGFKTEKLVKIS